MFGGTKKNLKMKILHLILKVLMRQAKYLLIQLLEFIEMHMAFMHAMEFYLIMKVH